MDEHVFAKYLSTLKVGQKIYKFYLERTHICIHTVMFVFR